MRDRRERFFGDRASCAGLHQQRQQGKSFPDHPARVTANPYWSADPPDPQVTLALLFLLELHRD